MKLSIFPSTLLILFSFATSASAQAPFDPSQAAASGWGDMRRALQATDDQAVLMQARLADLIKDNDQLRTQKVNADALTDYWKSACDKTPACSGAEK